MNDLPLHFNHDLMAPNPIPKEALENVSALLDSGSLYRYSCHLPEESEVSLMEKEFTEYLEAKFAVGVNSCAMGLYLSLLAAGLKADDRILMSVFTYFAIPSAIYHVGCTPVFIECDENYCIDISDLKSKITKNTKMLVLSHMRGHVSDMDAIVDICNENGVILVEDCAHSLGATYKGIHTGLFGKVSSFSTQSHKMINSGEGGIVVTNDEEILSKIILYTGSQSDFWKRHFYNSPICGELQEIIPNYSTRMSNLTAAVIRPQIKYVNEWVKVYADKYNKLVSILSPSEHIRCPIENKNVIRGQDTIQFSLEKMNQSQILLFVTRLNQYGINTKLFGEAGNPRYYKSWKFFDGIENIHLPQTDTILTKSCDIRLPLCLQGKDIEILGNIILRILNDVISRPRMVSDITS